MTSLQNAVNDVETIRALADRYGQAWNNHDVATIMSMHAPETAFHLHMAPYTEASTHSDIAAQFGAIFGAFPDLVFRTDRLLVREGLFTHEWTLTATLAGPFPIGSRTARPDGRQITVPGVDVVPCEGGLVRRKDSYVDGMSLFNQLVFD